MKDLFPPSRCTASLPDDLSKPYLVAEEKLDGSRYVLYIGCDPYDRQSGNALLSRRVSVVDSKHVDRTDNVPHITGFDLPDLRGTVLDGEIMATDFLGTNSVMNSGPQLAVQKQKENGKLNYNVFDIMSFRGKDVRGLPLEKRRKILVEVIKRIDNPHIKIIKQKRGNVLSFFKLIVAGGGEGLIIKDLRCGYGVSWAKMKKSYDVSVIVSGFKKGAGKYSSQIGSLALSVLHNGNLVEVGFCSGFDDKLRSEITQNPDKYKGKVVDVFAQESLKSGKAFRLRHPTFHRFRDDINASDCTLEKAMVDIKKRVKYKRIK